MDRVKTALQPSPPPDQAMEELKESKPHVDSEESREKKEPNDDMLIVHYQKDIKLEALARRAHSKNGSLQKKGRQVPPS